MQSVVRTSGETDKRVEQREGKLDKKGAVLPR